MNFIWQPLPAILPVITATPAGPPVPTEIHRLRFREPRRTESRSKRRVRFREVVRAQH